MFTRYLALLLGLLFFSFLVSNSTIISTVFAVKSSAPTVTYSSILADLDTRISSLEKRANSRPNEWLILENLASALFERAKLTNRLFDYTNVNNILGKAFELAPKGSGPMLLAARFNFSIHRLDEAERYLTEMQARPILRSTDKIALLILKSEIAFQRGQFDLALEGYRKCEEVAPGQCTKQLALYYASTGGKKEAEALLQQALKSTEQGDFQSKAWIMLQLGIISMHSGDYKEALSRVSEADRILPAWWLVREHIAEIQMLLKNYSEAVSIYEEVVAQTGLPQYMDALAECYERLGNTAEAKELIAKASKLWDEQLKLFPESASGHALEHYINFSSDHSKIVALAEANYKIRPGGQAQLDLANAYLKANRPQEALKHIELLLSSKFRTAELYAIASGIYENVGKSEQAKEFNKLCLELNPNYYGT